MKHIVPIVQSVGAGAAVALSWASNHSVGWAILHFAMGWFYVAYKLTLHFLGQ